MKTKIAVYTQTAPFWGGSYQYAQAVIEALASLNRSRVNVQVWHKDVCWTPFLEKLDIPAHLLDLQIPAAVLVRIMRIKKAMGEHPAPVQVDALNGLVESFDPHRTLVAWQPDICVLPQMGAPFFCPGAKHIGVIHDLMHRYEGRFPEVGAPEEAAERDTLFQTLVRYCHTLLVDSPIGGEHVRDCYQASERQIKVLPFAAAECLLKLSPRRPAVLPEKFFYYPAQFWLHKNHMGLARALAASVAQCPGIHVVLSGGTEKNGFSAFRALLEELGIEEHFSILGYVEPEEVSWLYRHARALIMPTFFGPTNIPPLEAMALGCPVAVSDIYGERWQCGEAALFFPPANDAALAEVLRRLWQDDALCGELRRKGLARHAFWNETHFKKCFLTILAGTSSGA